MYRYSVVKTCNSFNSILSCGCTQ